MDEGVVEGGEDTGNAEDELAWRDMLLARGPGFCNFCIGCRLSGSRVVAELACSGRLTLADLGAQGDVLLGSADSSFLRGHFDGICWGGGIEIAEVVLSSKRRSRQPNAAMGGLGRGIGRAHFAKSRSADLRPRPHFLCLARASPR